MNAGQDRDAPLLRMTGIVKTFPGVRARDGVTPVKAADIEGFAARASRR